MARPITVVVGPLAASSANKVVLSQKAGTTGTQFFVLNGAAGVFTANNVCLSQSPSGAGNLTLNGSTTTGTPAVAYLGSNVNVYFTSGGNDSGNTFTITGQAMIAGGGLISVTEVVTGSNASVASSNKQYYTISQIAISGASGGTVTVGTYGVATLDVARQLLFTPSGADSGITYLITGTDWTGTAISETLAGANNPATSVSVLNYLTVTSIKLSAASAGTTTVGTNGVAYSPWARFDDYGSDSQVSIQCTVSGTANYTLQSTLDDPNSLLNPVVPSATTWVNSSDTTVVNQTTTQQSNYGYAPIFARILLNSGTGSVTATFRQPFLQ